MGNLDIVEKSLPKCGSDRQSPVGTRAVGGVGAGLNLRKKYDT